MNRTELKISSKKQLKNHWGLIGGIFLLLGFINIILICIPILGWVVNLLIIGPTILGEAYICLKLARGNDISFTDGFYGFKFLWKATGLIILQSLLICVWSLLFWIPGIIKSLGYSMAFMVLIDNPDIKLREALRESERITKGYKMQIFILSLSFLGWALLSTLTFGIGYFWLIPYIQTTYANIYCELTNTKATNDLKVESLDNTKNKPRKAGLILGGISIALIGIIIGSIMASDTTVQNSSTQEASQEINEDLPMAFYIEETYPVNNSDIVDVITVDESNFLIYNTLSGIEIAVKIDNDQNDMLPPADNNELYQLQIYIDGETLAGYGDKEIPIAKIGYYSDNLPTEFMDINNLETFKNTNHQSADESYSTDMTIEMFEDIYGFHPKNTIWVDGYNVIGGELWDGYETFYLKDFYDQLYVVYVASETDDLAPNENEKVILLGTSGTTEEVFIDGEYYPALVCDIIDYQTYELAQNLSNGGYYTGDIPYLESTSSQEYVINFPINIEAYITSQKNGYYIMREVEREYYSSSILVDPIVSSGDEIGVIIADGRITESGVYNLYLVDTGDTVVFTDNAGFENTIPVYRFATDAEITESEKISQNVQ